MRLPIIQDLNENTKATNPLRNLEKTQNDSLSDAKFLTLNFRPSPSLPGLRVLRRKRITMTKLKMMNERIFRALCRKNKKRKNNATEESVVQSSVEMIRARAL
ncbi:hypothetical protein CDAR_599551 [Caerostris darwini]|uniref:Uncharacterized protein n=1 Tax=Caerostris darwini TaxID=1538125 RepID=A0AAV4NWN2_9ARAC|nr:hypothetical protein CDAR_599551 [Caerostris darwini]